MLQFDDGAEVDYRGEKSSSSNSGGKIQVDHRDEEKSNSGLSGSNNTNNTS